jgi:hypothetical protein
MKGPFSVGCLCTDQAEALPIEMGPLRWRDAGELTVGV